MTDASPPSSSRRNLGVEFERYRRESQRSHGSLWHALRIAVSLWAVCVFAIGCHTVIRDWIFTKVPEANVSETSPQTLDSIKASIVHEFDAHLSSLKQEVQADFEMKTTELRSNLTHWQQRFRDLHLRFEQLKGDLETERSRVRECKQQQQCSNINTTSSSNVREVIQEQLQLERIAAQQYVGQTVVQLQSNISNAYLDKATFNTRVQRVIDDMGAAKAAEEMLVLRMVESALQQHHVTQQQCSSTPTPTPTPSDQILLTSQQVSDIVREYLLLHISDRPIWLSNWKVLAEEQNLLDVAEVIEPTTPSLTSDCITSQQSQSQSQSQSLFGLSSLLSLFSSVVPSNVRHSHEPSQALSRTSGPGDCWGFCGHVATLTLELKAAGLPQHIVIEHIPVSQVHSVDSAPKSFSLFVYPSLAALASNAESSRHSLGTFDFVFDKSNTTHVQMYNVDVSKIPFAEAGVRVVQLQIHSNQGNPAYTCLYRLRVYGSFLV